MGEWDLAPYWRTLKIGGVINEKYPRGAESQMRFLKQGGHKVVKKGNKYFVVDRR
ncbi:MAG: hypothetical protein QXO32_03675 [Candidatus Bathyarchaeia archaeon]